jgi:hypothetical protein
MLGLRPYFLPVFDFRNGLGCLGAAILGSLIEGLFSEFCPKF